MATFVSLGCDCHPAHVLSTLGLRQEAYPFDWLDTDSSVALKYVEQNIRESFQSFVLNIAHASDDNIPYASNFPQSRFLHHQDISTNVAVQSSFQRRGIRFMNTFRDATPLTPLILLHNVKSTHVSDDFIRSVHSLDTFIQQHDSVGKVGCPVRLWIYIRYDEPSDIINESEACVCLANGSFGITTVIRYCRHQSTYGIWGNPMNYRLLLEEFVVCDV